MAATGTCDLNGETYTWESPTIGDLEHFEVTIGSLTDPKVANSIKARVYLAYLSLKKHHPDISVGVIEKWDSADLFTLWNMVILAVPFFRGVFDLEGKPKSKDDSRTDSSRRAPSPSDGDPPASGGSE